MKGRSETKNLRATENPFCAEQNGEIRFCVGYFFYEIRGTKRMRAQKPLYWLFVNNVCVKIIIGLKGLKGPPDHLQMSDRPVNEATVKADH